MELQGDPNPFETIQIVVRECETMSRSLFLFGLLTTGACGLILDFDPPEPNRDGGLLRPSADADFVDAAADAGTALDGSFNSTDADSQDAITRGDALALDVRLRDDGAPDARDGQVTQMDAPFATDTNGQTPEASLPDASPGVDVTPADGGGVCTPSRPMVFPSSLWATRDRADVNCDLLVLEPYADDGQPRARVCVGTNTSDGRDVSHSTLSLLAGVDETREIIGGVIVNSFPLGTPANGTAFDDPVTLMITGDITLTHFAFNDGLVVGGTGTLTLNECELYPTNSDAALHVTGGVSVVLRRTELHVPSQRVTARGVYFQSSGSLTVVESSVQGSLDRTGTCGTACSTIGIDATLGVVEVLSSVVIGGDVPAPATPGTSSKGIVVAPGVNVEVADSYVAGSRRGRATFASGISVTSDCSAAFPSTVSVRNSSVWGAPASSTNGSQRFGVQVSSRITKTTISGGETVGCIDGVAPSLGVCTGFACGAESCEVTDRAVVRAEVACTHPRTALGAMSGITASCLDTFIAVEDSHVVAAGGVPGTAINGRSTGSSVSIARSWIDLADADSAFTGARPTLISANRTVFTSQGLSGGLFGGFDASLDQVTILVRPRAGTPLLTPNTQLSNSIVPTGVYTLGASILGDIAVADTPPGRVVTGLPFSTSRTFYRCEVSDDGHLLVANTGTCSTELSPCVDRSTAGTDPDVDGEPAGPASSRPPAVHDLGADELSGCGDS